MAYIEFLNNDKKGDDRLANVIKYVFGNNGRHFTYYGGCAVDPDNAIYQMQAVKEHFGKTDGRQALHIVVSFDNKYIIADYEAYVIAPVISRVYGLV